MPTFPPGWGRRFAVVAGSRCHDFTDDISANFSRLVPADRPYRNNGLQLRSGIPPDEPRHVHSHLIARLLGNHLSLPVHEGRLGLGWYQAVLLVELDGPRSREVLVQVHG